MYRKTVAYKELYSLLSFAKFPLCCVCCRDYNPKAAAPAKPTPATQQFLISPITGEKIPANKIVKKNKNTGAHRTTCVLCMCQADIVRL